MEARPPRFSCDALALSSNSPLPSHGSGVARAARWACDTVPFTARFDNDRDVPHGALKGIILFSSSYFASLNMTMKYQGTLLKEYIGAITMTRTFHHYGATVL